MDILMRQSLPQYFVTLGLSTVSRGVNVVELEGKLELGQEGPGEVQATRHDAEHQGQGLRHLTGDVLSDMIDGAT